MSHYETFITMSNIVLSIGYKWNNQIKLFPLVLTLLI
jgi:hypothetical protein